jgi:hypothetical protein
LECASCGLRLLPTESNAQPAFAVYEFSATDQRWNAHSIHVLTLEREAISAITLFLEPRFFPDFGLPQFLPHNPNQATEKHGAPAHSTPPTH